MVRFSSLPQHAMHQVSHATQVLCGVVEQFFGAGRGVRAQLAWILHEAGAAGRGDGSEQVVVRALHLCG